MHQKKIFISTASEGLINARFELLIGLLKSGLYPLGMDIKRQNDNASWAQVQEAIKEADYYVILLGGHYGELSPIGLSHAHREFVYAVTKNKPILAVLHEKPHLLPDDFKETTREGKVRFLDFRRLVEDKSTTCYWLRHSDLSTMLPKVVPRWMSRYPVQRSEKASVNGGSESHASLLAEIERLRLRVKELEGELKTGSKYVQVPIEWLAKGNDKVRLGFQCHVYVGGDCKLSSMPIEKTWNQLMASLGPHMNQPISEANMAQILADAISKEALSIAQQKEPNAHAVRNVALHTESVQRVKFQLRALGFIEEHEGAKGKGPYWQLTKQGDQRTMELLVQHKP